MQKEMLGFFKLYPIQKRFFHRRHNRMSTEKIYHNTRAASAHVYQIINYSEK
jgi:hypothetical protein